MLFRPLLSFLLASYYIVNIMTTDSGLLGSKNERNVTFNVPITDHALPGHVFVNKSVSSEDDCMMECFLNGDCVAFNFDTSISASPNCQLCDSDQGTLIPNPGYIYYGTKNGCINNPCTNSKTRCQSGFGPQGYRCVCKKCYTGNNCQEYTRDSVLHFKAKSTNQDAHLNLTINDFKELTISVWIQLDNNISVYNEKFKDNKILTTIFSIIEGTGTEDQVSMYLKQDLKLFIEIKGCEINYGIPDKLFDGRWHNLVFSWSNTGSHTYLYIDGHKNQSNINCNAKLAEEVRFALGQEQDNSQDGGYTAHQSFVGKITDFNMWEKKLPEDQIMSYSKQCFYDNQNSVLNWTTIVKRKSNDVGFFCGLTCKDLGLTKEEGEKPCFGGN